MVTPVSMVTPVAMVIPSAMYEDQAGGMIGHHHMLLHPVGTPQPMSPPFPAAFRPLTPLSAPAGTAMGSPMTSATAAVTPDFREQPLETLANLVASESIEVGRFDARPALRATRPPVRSPISPPITTPPTTGGTPPSGNLEKIRKKRKSTDQLESPPSNVSLAVGPPAPTLVWHQPTPSALPNPFQLLPAPLRADYEQYVWAFFLGPYNFFPIDREVVLSAALATFSREGANGEQRKGRGASGPQASAHYASQAGLTSAVLAMGAQLCGRKAEAMKFVAKARQTLSLSMTSMTEMTAFTFGLLQLYYYGIRDFRLALFFTKMRLDIFNSLPPSDRSEALTAICDYTCLFMHIPNSPSCRVPAQLLDKDLRDIDALLFDSSPSLASSPAPYSALPSPSTNSATPLPTSHRAIYANLRLIGEAAGYLLLVERNEDLGSSDQVISLVDRDLRLCQEILAIWRPFGPLNELMSALHQSIEVWAIFLLVEVLRKRGARRTSPIASHPLPQRDQAEILKEEAKMYNEERRAFDEVIPILSRNMAKRFSSQNDSFATVENMATLAHDERLRVRPEQSAFLVIESHDLRGRATNLCRNIAAIARRHISWAKYFPVQIIIVFVNLCSVMAEWDLWPELEAVHSLINQVGQVWPNIGLILERISDALRMKRNFDSNPGQERPKIVIERLSALPLLQGLTPEDLLRFETMTKARKATAMAAAPQPDALEFDISAFWTAAPGELDLQSMLGEVESAPLDDPFWFL